MDWKYPGAKWWKVDLHTHSPASRDSRFVQGQEDDAVAEMWLRQFMDAEIDCVAVTDHNSGAWIDLLKRTYSRLREAQSEGFRELVLLPGVELSVNGGIHMLAIFDTSANSSDIDSLRGAVDYQGTPGDSDGVTRKSVAEVIAEITRAGALAIPAHVDKPKGLLRLAEDGIHSAIDPNTLRQALEAPGILAMEVVDPHCRLPTAYVDSNCNWCSVLGSDFHGPDSGNPPGTKFTWLKMQEPTLEGVRMALMDGDGFSVRRSDSTDSLSGLTVPKYLIHSVKVSEARYMGRGGPETFHFSPWFNALVGGRGTGKSTVTHALRLAFNREAELLSLADTSEPRRTFESFKRAPKNRQDGDGALDYHQSQQTIVQTTIIRDGTKYMLTWRQSDDRAVAEELNSSDQVVGSAQDVSHERFPIRIFSQGQITALAAQSSTALLALIDDAARTQPARRILDEAYQRYYTLRAMQREVSGRLNASADLANQLADIVRQLDHLSAQHSNIVLESYQRRTLQKTAIERYLTTVQTTAEELNQWGDESIPRPSIDDVFDSADATEASVLKIIGNLRQDIRDAHDTIKTASDKLASSVMETRASLRDSVWNLEYDRSVEQHTSFLSDLSEKGMDLSVSSEDLIARRIQLEEGIAGREQDLRRHAELEAQLSDQRETIVFARRSLTEARRQFLQRSVSGNPYVRIDLLPYGAEASAVEKSFRDLIGVSDDRFSEDILQLDTEAPAQGLVAEIVAMSRDKTHTVGEEVEVLLATLQDRLVNAAYGIGTFGGRFNNFLERQRAKQPEIADRLSVWSPEDGLRVEYSPRGDGHGFRPLAQASEGQRAAAMLAFLLAHGTEPLILDQPEDDLDNRLIYELVVQQLRANKVRRQVIVITHNANIVVNGDPEMVHALDFRAGQCRALVRGSLQDIQMREEVCKIMEGGREAFERRYRRIGQQSPQ